MVLYNKVKRKGVGMSVQRYPWMVIIYKGENRFLFIPIINHIGGYSVDANWSINLSCDDYEGLVKSIKSSLEYIRQSPISTLIPKERIPAWKSNSKYTTWASFWKNNIRGFIIYYEDGKFRVTSDKRATTPRQEYDGCIKVIDLPSGATFEEVAQAVLTVFEAAEEYYKTHKTVEHYPGKEITLSDDTKLTFKPPCDRHFEEEDFGALEIYQGYSYLSAEGAEPSAEFFLGMAPELDCSLQPENVRKCWEQIYGTAESFQMKEVSKGIFTRYAEMKNKSIHKISYFLQQNEDLVLECGMMLHMPNRREKLDEKLLPLFEEFAANCRI